MALTEIITRATIANMPKRPKPQTNRRDPNAVAFAIVGAATIAPKPVEKKGEATQRIRAARTRSRRP